MKNKNILTSIVCALLIVGCNGLNNSSSNTSSSSVSTSSKIEEVNSSSSSVETVSEFEQMLRELRKGVQLKGTVNQKSTYLDSDRGNPTGDALENTYNVSLKYQSQEQNGYAAKVSMRLPTGAEYVYIDTVAFEGEDGFAYYYDLNYDNTIKAFPHYDTNGRDYVNFGYYYVNPFHYLMEEDFIKVDENTYHLTKEKANFFASSVLGDIDPAFFEVNKVCEFKVENGMIKTINVVPADVYGYSLNYETWEYVYYFLEQSVTLSIEKYNNVKIDKPKTNVVPSDSREAIDNLQVALNKLESNNYTMKLQCEFIDENNTKYYENATYYYTGDELYYSLSEDQSVPNNSTDIYFHKENNKLVPLGYEAQDDGEDYYAFSSAATPKFIQLNDSYTYENVIPVISGVNADIFNYNKKYTNYTLVDTMIPYIGALAFIPQISTFSHFSSDSGTKFLVRLNSENEIDYIDYKYSYNDGFFYEDGSIRITFENVGTTEIPHNIQVID